MSTHPRFAGADYIPSRDDARLTGQLRDKTIVAMAKSGFSRGVLAKEFGVTPQRIQQICKGAGVVFSTSHLPLLERLMRKVIICSSGCWEWQGAGDALGYGHVNLGNGRYAKAHRAVYEQINGVNCDGAYFIHSCDNPKCVNPAHLRIGTAAENAWDREVKLRGRTNKLTPQQVVEIRDRLSTSSNLRLSKEYGVHRSTIERIRSGRNWRWLDEALSRNNIAPHPEQLSLEQHA